MDYDESDFQGNNLQLTGEGSSKFSPVLHPYALPKFDFDDSIQGHLRFDSLVENEVFLGIPSQEDNQWIEDFSRGSSGIEFSSSAAESCSISRRNNVWSEATSSESVEMLLKSVGQEEMVPGETIIEESDAVHELGHLTKRRESNSKQDDRMEDIKDSDPALPLDQAPENFCGMNESAEVEHPHVKCTSQIQETELPAYVVSSGESDPNAVGGNCVVFLDKESLGIEQKCDDANQGEADTSVNEFLNNKKQEDISVSRMQTDKLDSSLQNVTASAGDLDDQEIPPNVSHICFESASGLAKDIDKGVEEHRVQCNLADIDNKILSELDNPLCITSMVESVEEHAIEASINTFEKLSSLELKGDCDLQIGEGCSENVPKHPAQGSQCEVVVLSEATEIKQQLKGNMLHAESLTAFQGGDSFGEHVVEVSNTVAGISASLELKTCSPAEITLGLGSDIEQNKNFVGSDDKMDRGASANSSEESVLFVMDNKSSRDGDGSSINNTADLASLMVASSSAELREEKPSTENLEDRNDASGVHIEENMAVDSSLPPLLLGSMQMCKESLSSDQGDAHDCNQDVPFLERGSVKLPLDSSNMECEIVESLDGDERAGSLGSVEVSKENVERAYRSEVDVTNRTEPTILDVNVEDTDLASHDTCGGIPLHSRGGHTAAEVIDYTEERKSPLIVQETDGEAHEEESLVTVKDDSQVHSHSRGGAAASEVIGTEEQRSSLTVQIMDVEVHESLLTMKDDLKVRSHSRGGDTASEVIDHNEEQKSSLTVQIVDVEVHESLSTVKDDSQVVNELASVSEVEQGAPCDGDTDVPRKMVDQAELVVETCDTTTQSEQVIVANEYSQECCRKLEVHPVFRDSAVKANNAAEAVALEHQKETEIEKNDEVGSLKLADAVIVPNKGEVLTEPAFVSLVEPCFDVGQKDHEDNEATMASGVNNCGQSDYDARGAASNDHQVSFNVVPSCEYDAKCMVERGGTSVEPLKPNCGSATITTCTELPQSEKDDQKDVKGDVVENTPLSEFTVCVEGKITSTSINSTGLDTSKEERSFTFDVSPLAGPLEGETGKGWQSVPTIQACKISTVVEGSPSTGGQMIPRIMQEISRGSPQTPDGGTARVGAKATPERKTRRGSGKTGKESSRMGNHVNETTPVKPRGSVERGGARPGSVVPIPTSNLPDLNTSAPPSVLFQQPFTDLQQVQLRAQIFVYGSLIQGGAPPEAFMVSAFGPSDVGRNIWEPAWRAFVERLHGQKLLAKNSETPMHSRSGSKALEHASQQGAFQSKVLSSPVGRVSSKGTSSPVVNPMMPLSSPLWNISTPDSLQSSGMQRGPVVDYHQTLSPLHPYQTPPNRNFVGHTTSWPPTPFPSPWVASPQTSAFDISSRLPVLPITETVKLIPVKESSVPDSSGAKHVSSISVAQSGGSSVFLGTSPLIDMKKLTVSPGPHSADSKARRRKRVPVTEDLGQISLTAQNQTVSVSAPVVSSHLLKQVPDSEDILHFSMLSRSQTESVFAPVVNTHFSTSVAVTSPACFVSKSNSGKFLTASSPTSSGDRTKRGDQNVEKNILISEETFSKVEEAKLQAEDAAVHAAAAVSHCQDVWSQVDKQKNSGLISDVEAKLASAAVAISAAASVAKAAAAAANIASNAAAQAKQMADEVLVFSGTGNSTQSNAISLPRIVNDLGKAAPAFILKGGDGSNCSTSVISVAREAARRRVEAASTASKHAENLDAIVKAAELAAEAVSQAGKIVAMGDPLPLNKLIEAGPEGYWKLAQLPSEQGVKSNNVNGYQSNINNVEEVPNVSAKQSKEGPSDKDKQILSSRALSPLSREICRDTEDQMEVVDGMSGSVTGGENFTGQRRRTSELAKTIGVVPESEIGSRSNFVISHDEYEMVVGTSKENNIKEGSLVEVFKNGGEFKAAWFPANVLSLKDGKAFVCYTELQSDEGSGKLKEWVPLEGEGSKAPLIRIAHPMTNMQFEGTKKRSRAVTKDYAWSVGDRVDAWTQDCWREGVVTEKNNKDETTLTVLFPARGETSVFRTWHLRPTLIWKDGLWIEWPREDLCSQGDTPQQKRLKLGSPAIEGRAKDKTTKDFDLVESREQDESRLLPLPANENVFNVGKNTRDEIKPDALRTMRTGLQKEGSRVVFGVPKPGKKRKFMDVSKHYVSERSTKNNTANDSVNFRKYLMPQGSGSRGWKNNSKEKQAAESKARVLKGKPPSVPARTLPRKENLLTSTSDATTADQLVKDSIRSDENKSGQQNHLGFGSLSNTEGQAEGPLVFTSLAHPPDDLSKVGSTSNAKSGRLNKGKLALAGGKTAKVEAKDKSIPEVVEPRRSVRRIQPTSRLLEGLQSSLIVSKSPSVSHDKSHRSQIRGTSKGNNK